MFFFKKVGSGHSLAPSPPSRELFNAPATDHANVFSFFCSLRFVIGPLFSRLISRQVFFSLFLLLLVHFFYYYFFKNEKDLMKKKMLLQSSPCPYKGATCKTFSILAAT